MLKKIFILTLVFLSINPCFAFKWEDSKTGEKPYGVFVSKAMPIDDNVKNLSIEEKKEYLQMLYNSNGVWYIKDKKIYSVSILKSNDPIEYYRGRLYYDNDLNLIMVNDSFGYRNYGRFVGLYNEEKNKYGLYDLKRKRFSGFKYDEIQEAFSGVPIARDGDKRRNVQPFKSAGITAVKYPALIVLTVPVMAFSGILYLLYER